MRTGGSLKLIKKKPNTFQNSLDSENFKMPGATSSSDSELFQIPGTGGYQQNKIPVLHC
jgi:hypothetical protein